jgi:hypothetical protein
VKIEGYRYFPEKRPVIPLPSSALVDRVPAPDVPMGLRLMRRSSSSSSVSTTEDFVIESLGDHYYFPPFGEVRNFLKTEPRIASLLFVACEAINTHFGNGTFATLRLSRGPDSACNNCREILVVIRSDRNAEETMTRLDSLNSDWWNENVPVEVRLKMLFMVEFA